MHEKSTIEQARFLHNVIRRLQARLIAKHSATPGSSKTATMDLTMPQLSALMVIRDHDKMSLKELANSMQVSSPSASTMVDRLLEMGMVERNQNKVDRREIRVQLSSAGRDAVESLENQFLSALVELLTRLGPETSGNWCGIYESIDKVIDEIEAEGQETLVPEGVK